MCLIGFVGLIILAVVGWLIVLRCMFGISGVCFGFGCRRLFGLVWGVLVAIGVCVFDSGSLLVALSVCLRALGVFWFGGVMRVVFRVLVCVGFGYCLYCGGSLACCILLFAVACFMSVDWLVCGLFV